MHRLFNILIFIILLQSCVQRDTPQEDIQPIPEEYAVVDTLDIEDPADEPIREFVEIKTEVLTGDYHRWVKTILDSINTDRSYSIDEYQLIHANHWIIDTLRKTDYYYLKDLGIISKDPKTFPFLRSGQKIQIPDEEEADRIRIDLENTRLDLNIPEYKLRIYQYDSVVATFPVRVGRNDRRYLAMAKTTVNLRTMPGTGEIVRINRNPVFINPRDNKRYQVTRRDDNVVTGLPNIPWIEPEINGIRYGQLIHPTTNLETVGKPVSNGCIGLRESDAWSVFFYAPLGTKINIRYDLEIEDETGSTIRLENIYPGFEKYQTRKKEVEQAAKEINTFEGNVCYCGKSDEG